MSEERRAYRYDRVLIESDRILSPQFHDAVVFLSGAQIELLRNMTQYLNRLNTYVSEYHPDYYLTPDASDYDAILAIVADMEEKLMGNPNTIWGYSERWTYSSHIAASGGGDGWRLCVTVPEHELLVLQAVEIHHDADTAKEMELYIDAAGKELYFWHDAAAEPDIYHQWLGPLTLSEGDKLFAHLVAPGDGKEMWVTASGYIMIVP